MRIFYKNLIDLKMPQNSISILYIDDEPSNLRIFKTAFKRIYHVFIAETIEAALEILENEDIQIIITDQRMPQMTGSEFLTLIKDQYPDAIRMILTGYSDVKGIIDGINQGRIYKYITKPWDKAQMTSLLEEVSKKTLSNQLSRKKMDSLENNTSKLEQEVYNLRQELKQKKSLIQILETQVSSAF